MKRVPRYLVGLGSLLGGILFAASFGAPLAGSVASFFWLVGATDVTNDDRLAADRIVDRVESSRQRVSTGVYLSEFQGYATEQAKLPHRVRANYQNAIPDIDMGLDGYPSIAVAGIAREIWQSGFDNDKEVRRMIYADALTHLPKPLLGALDGCVSGSLLAPLCRTYARTVMLREKQAKLREIMTTDKSILRHMSDQDCVLNFMIRKAGGGRATEQALQ